MRDGQDNLEELYRVMTKHLSQNEYEKWQNEILEIPFKSPTFYLIISVFCGLILAMLTVVLFGN